jgi:hypothetical protein
VVVICLFSWRALMGGWGRDMMRGKDANEVILVILGIMQGRVVSVVLLGWVLNGRDTIPS